MMRNISLFAVLITGSLLPAAAQATRSAIDPLLKQPLESQVLVAEQLRHFMLKRVPELPTPSSPEAWQKEAERLALLQELQELRLRLSATEPLHS